MRVQRFLVSLCIFFLTWIVSAECALLVLTDKTLDKRNNYMVTHELSAYVEASLLITVGHRAVSDQNQKLFD